MSSIQNIPEELLLVIFSNLYGSDLFQCQHVCRAWYIPARIKYLNKKVYLRNTTRAKRFIAAINRNPSSRFLAAVKEIDIFSINENWNITLNVLHKLFFRFPNLESVSFDEAIVKKFDDDMCKTFLQYCPKLKRLTVHYFTSVPKTDLRKVRLLLTRIDIGDIIYDVKQFVANCPRLQVLNCSGRFNTFEKLLPILANIPNELTTIDFYTLAIDTDHFMERYSQTKTQQEQNGLLERISRITKLKARSEKPLSKGALEFIVECMTGLKEFKIHCALPDSQQFQLCSNMINLMRSIKRCQFSIVARGNVLWDSLPLFAPQVFERPARTKIFQLYLEEDLSPQFFFETNTDTLMRITTSNQHLSKRRTLLDDIVMDMDTFTLNISPFHSKAVHMYVYDAFFRTKSTVKQVTLQGPETIIRAKELADKTVAQNHTFVEKLTIVLMSLDPLIPLLERCSVAFPNLRLLILNGPSTGWFKGSTPKRQIRLAKLTLERLVIDFSQKDLGIEEEKFILIKVEDLSLGNKCWCGIPSDNSRPTRIDSQDIKDVVDGKDFVVINFIVGSLKHLEVVTPLETKYGTKLKARLHIELTSSSNK